MLLAICLVALAACGSDDDDDKGPPGSADNPVVAKRADATEGRTAEREAAPRPSRQRFSAILEQQRRARARARGRSRRARGGQINPCALVTKAQAEAILKERLLDPVVAPQGPTCVYRNRSRSSFTTVAIESVALRAVRRRMKRDKRVRIAGRSAWCGVYGRPMLYLRLSRGRVLSIAAPCAVAVRFARRAAPRLLR